MSQSLQFMTPSRAPYFTLPKFPRISCTRFPVINLPNTKRSIIITPSLSSFLHATSSRSLPSGNAQTGAAGVVSALSVGATGIEVDAVTEAELKENGFRSTRRTKLICTIGPATCGFEQLEALAVGGMNVARINMCHGSREWHQTVIERVRRLNDEKGFAVAIMMDTEGSEIHMGDLGGAASAKTEDGEIWTFSVRAFGTPRPERTINVNYDGFAEDVKVGDELLVDGGMVRFEVTEKIGPDVKCRCTDPGLLLPQANLTLWRNGSLVSERNAMLPTISSKLIGGLPNALILSGSYCRLLYLKLSLYDEMNYQSQPMVIPMILSNGRTVLAKVKSRNMQEAHAYANKDRKLIECLIDWLDIDFGIAEGVDFIAISFVKSAEVINHLKSYIAARACGSEIAVIAKMESVDSLKNLEEIIQASDGAMVARGDLGAQIPLEQVPSAQQKIVQLCRQLNKPVIVASQLLESMIEYPTATRAEVADVSEAVRQRADALMLSGESAMGQYPEKALAVLRSVSVRIEKWWREEKCHEAMELLDVGTLFADSISEEICNSAAKMDNFNFGSILSSFVVALNSLLNISFGFFGYGLLTFRGQTGSPLGRFSMFRSTLPAFANNLEADALFVYTKTGHMASLLSRCRPDCPIFAFTTTTSVRRRLNLQWGLIPFRLSFSDDMDANLNKTFSLLKARGMIKSGDLVIAVSDMLQSIQVMNVP
ncbi:hypothetical protein GOBAR_AA35960 [Gossypium barbadense]|uniref:pyruvate kinase n=1 Tax=Gossypium barbadense TaxID=3634 RepID=A0A2P5W0Y1_GOSBA|nr:hypothetical protein GOBAR_AA35960 [Gossypium barbadense]